MIQYIDIKNFGSFSNFVWNKQIKNEKGDTVEFKKLNILYGRNYSGKTTLSRIFRCLETGELPAKYTVPEFSIKTDVGTISQSGIDSHSHHVRVFNKDFVDENLSFLRNDDGNVEPFAVLGGDNTKIEKEIEKREKALGSVEEKSGYRHDHAEKKRQSEAKVAALNIKKGDRTRSLRDKARKLKQSPAVFGDVNYDIRKIEVDIEIVQKQEILPVSIEENQKLRQVLKQEPLPDIGPLSSPDLQLGKIREQANVFLSREIKPSKPIHDLLENALLQAWAKEGIPLHQDKRTTCGFCGNPLPMELWEKLDQHFSKESKDLDDALNDLLEKTDAEYSRVQKLMSVKKEDLYPTLHTEFQIAETGISNKTKSYLDMLSEISSALKMRKADPFTVRDPLEDDNAAQDLSSALAVVTQLIGNHENTTKGLESEQTKAQKTLRFSEVSSFITTAKLSEIETEITTLNNDAETLGDDAAYANELVLEHEQAIEELRKNLRDERRGAEKVNEFLSHYFGHDSLRLVAMDEAEGGEQGIKFEIKRADMKAYNLSDGECSLIAFCYFMAKLYSAESEGKDLIIYIDDPISSLDSDHIFFAFSLIQGLIATPADDGNGNKKDRYKQLFISTHNLDFLKFLKRLIRPKTGGNEHFLLARTEQGSLLELMPFYLRQYVTEFHYLFDQICSCTDTSKVTEGHHCFFSFGNNLRKFLEIYLFFKYPFCENSSGDYNTRVERFFDDDPATEPMVMRVTNELSHGGEMFDRSVKPIEHAEISKMAAYILTKIRNQDPEQYADLLQAIKCSDPLELASITQGKA